MATHKINFTKAALEKLPLPTKRKLDYYKDIREAGLEMIVTSGGAKTFYLYKKIEGKADRIKIGRFPDLSVENARKAAQTFKGHIAAGLNPNEEKRRVRDEYTFKQLFDEYMERHSKPNKKSWRHDEREINKFLSHWFKRKISTIKKHEVERLHANIGKENGYYQANHLLERIRSIYNKAIEWGWQGINPAIGIKKFKEKSRDRFIQEGEFPLFFEALDSDENDTARDYIYMSLFTGARKTNVLSMRWEQINWERKEWRIPETKNGESIDIPLIPQAIELLKTRKVTAKNQWVFHGEGKNKNGHLADPKKTWNRIRNKSTLEIWKKTPKYKSLIQKVERNLNNSPYIFTISKLCKCVQDEAKKQKIELPTGLLDLRLHDIRRTLGSYQVMTGASLPVIGKTLGHKSPQSTQVYARMNLNPVRDSMNKATDLMFSYRQDDIEDLNAA